MNFLQRLTDPALKRFYKFALKKLIGRFLKDDLVLNQLQVELRAGKVELRDLNLDEVFLSQHVPNQAFRVVSASVGRLRASISYSTLLTDSASITLEDVEVVVVPHDGSSPFPNQKGQFQRQPPAHDIGRDIVGPPTYAAACDEGTFPEYVSTEGGGADGMDFVASWIEQICATVKVSIKNISLILRSEDEAGAPALVLYLPKCDYRDTTADHIPHGSLAYSAVGPVTYKTISVAPWHIYLQMGKQRWDILDSEGLMNARLKIDESSSRNGVPLVDCEIGLRSCMVRVCPGVLHAVHSLISAFSVRAEPSGEADGTSPAHSGLGPLFQEEFWYVGDGFGEGDENGNDDIDYKTLEQLLFRYHEERARLMKRGQALEDSIYYDAEDAPIMQSSGSSGIEKQSLDLRLRFHLRECVLFAYHLPRDSPESSIGKPGFKLSAQFLSMAYRLTPSGADTRRSLEVMSLSLDDVVPGSCSPLYPVVRFGGANLYCSDDEDDEQIAGPPAIRLGKSQNSISFDCLPLMMSLNPSVVLHALSFLEAVGSNTAQPSASVPTSVVQAESPSIELTLPSVTVSIQGCLAGTCYPLREELLRELREGSLKDTGWQMGGEGLPDAPSMELHLHVVSLFIATGDMLQPQSPALLLRSSKLELLLALPEGRHTILHVDGSCGEEMQSRNFIEVAVMGSSEMMAAVPSPPTPSRSFPSDTVRAWEPRDPSGGVKDAAAGFSPHNPSPVSRNTCSSEALFHEGDPAKINIVLPSVAIGLTKRVMWMTKEVIKGLLEGFGGCMHMIKKKSGGPSHSASPSGAERGAILQILAHQSVSVLYDDDEIASTGDGRAWCSLTLSGMRIALAEDLMSLSARDFSLNEADVAHRTARSPLSDAIDIIDDLLTRSNPSEATQSASCIGDHHSGTWKGVPLFYRTPWIPRQSPNALCLLLESGISPDENDAASNMFNLSITLHHITMRHSVPLLWPARLTRMLARKPSAISLAEARSSRSRPEKKGNACVALFVIINHAVIDYSPAPSTLHKSLGRAVLYLELLRLSANIVEGAAVQTVKVAVRDASLLCSDICTDYVLEDSRLCVGPQASSARGLRHNDSVPITVQDYLEQTGFASIATLSFTDALLRTKAEGRTVLELWMGNLHVYTCGDSLRSTTALLSNWWLIIQQQLEERVKQQQQRTESVPAHISGEDDEGCLVEAAAASTAPESILKGIDEDAFKPREPSSDNPFRALLGGGSVHTDAQGKDGASSSAVVEKSALLIEDYYCLKGSPAPSVESSVQQEVSGGPEVGPESPVARWLAPVVNSDDDDDDDGAAESHGGPNAPFDLGLSMLSAVSDNGSAPWSDSGLGGSIFNLPRAIDIEMEDRFADKQGAQDCDSVLDNTELGAALGLLDEHSSALSVDVDAEDLDRDDWDSNDEGAASLSSEEVDGSGANSSPDFLQSPMLEDEGSRWYDPEESLVIFPHHMPIPKASISGKNISDELSQGATGHAQDVALTLVVHDLSICWRMFKGHDWVASAPQEPGSCWSGFRTGQPVPQQHSSPQEPADGEDGNARRAALLSAILEDYDGTQGSGSQPAFQSIRLMKLDGGSRHDEPNRDTNTMIQVALQNVKMRMDCYVQPDAAELAEREPGTEAALLSNLALEIRDMYISDSLNGRRPRKTLGHWRNDAEHPRECHQSMFTMQLTSRNPSQRFLPGLGGGELGDEYMLKVRMLPLHLAFGQYTVDFLVEFFKVGNHDPDSAGAGASAPDFSGEDDGTGTGGNEGSASQEFRGPSPAASPLVPASSAIFFQSCDIGPCKLRIDYVSRPINAKALQAGAYLELLNLFPLEGVTLTVSPVQQSGVMGAAAVFSNALQSWVRDITSSQMHKFLAGTAAVRPLVHVGQGVANLVLIPLRQYRRDGKLLRGIKDGTFAFLRTVTIETLTTGSRIAGAIARTLDDVISPADQVGRLGEAHHAAQPDGVRASLGQAYTSLSREVQLAANAVVAIPYEEGEERGGYVRTVVRALPVAVLRPVVGASEAVSFVLLGFRNQLQPNLMREEEAMWHHPPTL